MRFTVSAVLGFLLLLVTAAPLWAAPAIALSRKAGPPGTEVTVTGQGYGASKAIDIRFDGSSVGEATSDAGGAFTFTFNIPADAQPGRRPIVATQDSDLFARKNFNVRTDWSQFHGNDAHHTGVNPTENTLNEGNAPDLALLWRQPIGPFGTSVSPTIGGGHAYIAGGDGKIYGFDAFDGTPISGFPVATGDSFSRGAPIYTPGGLFVASVSGKKLYGFDPDDGTALPHFPIQLSSFNFGSASWAGGKIYVGTFDGKVYGIDPATGLPLPNFPITLDGGVYGSLTVEKGKGYVGTSAGTFYCIDLATGTFDWTYQVGSVITTTASLIDGYVYFGADNGRLYGLDIRNGVPQPGYPFSAGAEIGSSPTVTEDGVFFGSFDKKVYHLSRHTARRIRTLRQALEVWGSPVVGNGILVFNSFGRLSVHSVATGALLWSIKISSWQTASAALVNGVIYVGSGDGFLRAFAPQ